MLHNTLRGKHDLPFSEFILTEADDWLESLWLTGERDYDLPVMISLIVFFFKYVFLFWHFRYSHGPPLLCLWRFPAFQTGWRSSSVVLSAARPRCPCSLDECSNATGSGVKEKNHNKEINTTAKHIRTKLLRDLVERFGRESLRTSQLLTHPVNMWILCFLSDSKKFERKKIS